MSIKYFVVLLLVGQLTHLTSTDAAPANSSAPYTSAGAPAPLSKGSNTFLIKDPEMTWKAWFTFFLLVIILYLLCTTSLNITGVFVISAVILYLFGIIKAKYLFYGLTNDGPLAMAMLHILIQPIKNLPWVQQMVRWCMQGGTSPIVPLLKVCLVTYFISIFVEVMPVNAMMTHLIVQCAHEFGHSPSQFLIPMSIASRLANWSLISALNNLVVSGLMEEFELAPIGFFELAKVGIPMSFLLLPYLVLAPSYLLPKREGGLIKLMQEKGCSFMLQVVVCPTSRLIGSSTRDVAKQFPSTNVVLMSLERGSTIIHPLSGMEVVQAGDIIVVSGDVEVIVASMELLGLEHVVESRNAVPAMDAAPADTTEPREDNMENTIMENAATVTSPTNRPQQNNTVFEVVLSGSCPCNKSDVRSGHFQKHYSASVLAIRSFKGIVMQGEDMLDHKFGVGDSVLLLASKDFNNKWRRTYEFLTINGFDNRVLEVELRDHYFSLPSWFPIGQFVGDNKSRRVLRVPGWYNNVSIAVFLGFIIASTVGVEITIACIIAVCALSLSGVTTTADALHEVDWRLYIMMSYSFAIGTAVDSSGLAAVIAFYIAKMSLQGFWFLFVVSFITSVISNVITTQTAVQVMFPVVFRTLQAQGVNPLAGMMVLAHTSVLACSTPFGHSANVVVTGPGGYTAKDWVTFGLPINIAIMILCPLLATLIYE